MQIPILGIGMQGKSPNVSAQRRVNLYLESHQDGDKTSLSAHGTPGLTLFHDFGNTPVRGMLGVDNFLYVVHRGTFYRVNNASVEEVRGAIASTTGLLNIEHNGTQVLIPDGNNGYIYNIATNVFTQISDPDFPGAVHGTFLDGFFIVNKPGTGQFFLCALLNGLSWDALAFSTAESNPDKLVRPFAERSLLYLFGEFSAELWSNTGSLDFPFSRMQGGSIEWGLAAGHSLVKFDDSLCWLARNRLGQVSAVRAAGLEITRISTQELEDEFSKYEVVSDATGYSYMLNTHAMYQINFPSAERSWLYDGKTGVWSQLKSFGSTRHRGAIATAFLDRIMVADYSSGKIYRLDPHVSTDNGQPIIAELIGGHIFDSDQRELFPSEVRIEIETGVGLATGQGSNPQIMFSMSRDGGHTFGNERFRTIGRIGEFKRIVRFRRWKNARDFVPRLRISDPVKIGILRGSMDYERGTS